VTTARPPAEEVGYGEEPTEEDRRWAAAVSELTGPSALVRVAGNARATVGTVALVGTALTGLGLLSVPTLAANKVAWWFAVGAATLAFAAVVAGLLYLALRLERVNVEDLDQVKGWYQAQLDRVRLAVVASWLLIGALVLGGAAAGIAIARAPDGPDPTLGLRLSGNGDARTLGADVTVGNLDAGDVVVTRLLGLGSASCDEVVLLQATSRADGTGKATATGTVEKLPCNDTFRLEVRRSGRLLASVTVP
jgi:hypothetical protein